MTTAETWPGQLDIAATCGSPKGFPGGGRCEAAKLPEPCHLDRTRAVCLFRAVAAVAACGSSLALASLHNTPVM